MYKALNKISLLIVGAIPKIYDTIKDIWWAKIARLKLEICDSQIGSLRIKGKYLISIGQGAKVIIGKEVIFGSGPYNSVDNITCSKIIIQANAIFSIGDNSGLSSICINVWNKLIIGKNVNIGAGTFIMDTNFHSKDYLIRQNRILDSKPENGFVDTKPIIIMDNVFIGARSIICKGVTIGANSIIAAGSVVVKNIPNNEIWGGNPAMFIRIIK